MTYRRTLKSRPDSRLHRIAGVGALAMVASTAVFSRGASRASADDVQFDRDVRPILADNCFKCHGPDAGSRMARLRLDTHAGATEIRSNGRPVIVPGDADRSELIRRITAVDPQQRMPPTDGHKRLSIREIELLRRWIDDGAEWETHWAFVPPQPVDVPGTGDGWGNNEIDVFVRNRLADSGLAPSEQADRERLLRRVTLDLTGLGPTIAEIDAFLNDQSDDAYERVVDRLLASSKFGERMAVSWLDIARYADSYGYQSDQLSPTWPYRDWLVRAINDNLPYDEFIAQQLAGDLLPNAGREERLATAFNRLHRMTNEGGSIEEEYRVEYAADRVRTMGTAFMGLTLECARCHDHKFDPISTREYYGLFAFFNSIDEWGMYHDSARVPTPTLLLPTEAQEEQIESLEHDLRTRVEYLDRVRIEEASGFAAWLDAQDVSQPVMPGLVGRYRLDSIEEGNRLANTADEENPGSTSDANSIAGGRVDGALHFTGDDEATFPRVAGGMQSWSPFSVGFWLRLPEHEHDAIIFHRSGGTDVGRFGTELSLKNSRLFFAMIRFWPGNAIAVQSVDSLPRGQWIHVVATNEGSGDARGLKLFLNGEESGVEVLRNRLLKSPGAGGDGISFGARFRDAGLKDGAIDELYVFNRAIAPVEAATLYDGQSLTTAIETRDAALLREYYFAAHSDPVADATAARSEALRALLSARDAVLEVPVMEELPRARPTYVLQRGDYDSPRADENRVARITPSILTPWTDDAPRNRLGLARWLTDPDHPLTARVAVNRYWQVFFGRGLVQTSEDFGIQGSRPTHPLLLDHLARDFIESGWNVKALCRKIVTSATYMQDSSLRPELLARDPENLLLARGPSRRLSAEMLRDVCLAASGLMDDSIGGPPVSPYQPEQLWREANSMSPAYRQSVGTSLYRRSLYSVWKRTAPLPNMIAFDASGRESCTTRRQETNTPVQALVLMNDPQFVEAARVLAVRAVQEADDADSIVRRAFRLLTGRHPLPDEQALLIDLFHEQRAIFAAEPTSAEQLLSIGESQRDVSINPIDAAAYTVVVQAIMNADATVWKR